VKHALEKVCGLLRVHSVCLYPWPKHAPCVCATAGSIVSFPGSSCSGTPHAGSGPRDYGCMADGVRFSCNDGNNWSLEWFGVTGCQGAVTDSLSGMDGVCVTGGSNAYLVTCGGAEPGE
jgi:hypothetical protein